MDLISREETMTVFTNEYELYQDDVNLICKIPSAFEGMTNGEVFQAIFPNASVFENQDNEPYPYIDVFLCGDKDMNCYSKDWWNAPYKGVSE